MRVGTLQGFTTPFRDAKRGWDLSFKVLKIKNLLGCFKVVLNIKNQKIVPTRNVWGLAEMPWKHLSPVQQRRLSGTVSKIFIWFPHLTQSHSTCNSIHTFAFLQQLQRNFLSLHSSLFFATSRMEFWVVVSNIFYFHPKLFGKMNPIGRSHIVQMGWWFNQQPDFGWPEPDLQGGHRHCHGDLAGERPESASLLREPRETPGGNSTQLPWPTSFTSPQKTKMEPQKWGGFLDVSPFSKQVSFLGCSPNNLVFYSFEKDSQWNKSMVWPSVQVNYW